MRYYDISGRVAVYNLAHAVTCTSNATSYVRVPTSANCAYVDRTGYYSYIAHAVISNNMDDAAETCSVALKLQTSADGATWTDITSTTTTDANYKQLYLNATGVAANFNNLSAGFQDQPYVYTNPGHSLASHPAVLDVRIFGSLRDAKVVGKYIAPYLTVINTDDTGNTSVADVDLILGGGDQMPVFEAGTAGTNTYYSKGQ
jgi:hypothetical protein